MQAGYTVTAAKDISYMVLSSTLLAFYKPQTILLSLSNSTNQPDTNLYLDNELLPDSDLDDNSQHSYDDQHPETITQITENLGPIDPLSCYNKFLFYHRLPPLEHPQTIFTFLQYIRHDFPSYYSPDLIKISISNNKDHDNEYTEAHIYLPHEPYPLPNHFIPPFASLLVWFRYVSLKSKQSLFLTPPLNPTYYPLNLSVLLTISVVLINNLNNKFGKITV